MIRINLLGRARPRVKRRIAIAGTLQLALFLIPLVLAIGALGVHNHLVVGEITELQQKIDEANRQKLTMAQLQKEIKEFEEKQAALQTRLNVIEELRRSQKGPSQLLDALGDTVNRTETLWLTRLDERGTKITLEGVAGSVNAVANFITNLHGSGFFQNVEIKEAVQSTDNPSLQNYTFSLSCDFVLKAAQAQPASPPAATGKGT
jgi:Tfp pilus assembly protein PilN